MFYTVDSLDGGDCVMLVAAEMFSHALHSRHFRWRGQCNACSSRCFQMFYTLDGLDGVSPIMLNGNNFKTINFTRQVFISNRPSRNLIEHPQNQAK